MNSTNNSAKYPYEQSFSFSSWIGEWIKKMKYVVQLHFKLVLFTVILGAIIGLLYSIYKPVRYKAEITFSVEDSKSIGGGLLSS